MNKVIVQGGSVGLVTLALLIYSIAFSNGAPTCNKYTVNTFLYILMGILTIFMSTVTLGDMKIGELPWYVTFIVSIISILGLHYVKAENVGVSHLIWLVLMVSLGASLLPIYKYGKRGMITQTAIVTAIMVGIMTGFAFWKPEMIKTSWQNGLILVLLAGIILEFVNIFFVKSNGFDKMLNYGMIALFSVFLMIDTKEIQERGRECKFPNYPKSSVSVIMDIVNLFIRLLSVGSGNKNRGLSRR